MTNKSHNYAIKLDALAASGKFDKHLHVVNVLHESWCPCERYDGTCECDPEIRVRVRAIPLRRIETGIVSDDVFSE